MKYLNKLIVTALVFFKKFSRVEMSIHFLKLITFALFFLTVEMVKADDIFQIGDKLTTPTSVVLTRPGSKAECMRLQGFDTCQLLEINGNPVISEYYVSIDAALPSKFNTNVIFATGSTGGNACCEYHYLIDISTPKPLVIKVVSLPKPYNEKPVIFKFDSGFTYENYGDDKGEYGEAIRKVYQYKYGSGRVEVLKSSPGYNFTPMKKKKYPEEILDDPVNREPLIKLMGKTNFLKMRERLVVQGEITRHMGDIYSGQGCMPHMCGSEESLFVLDSAKKNAWAIFIFDEGGQEKGKFFGSFINDSGVVRQIIDKWLYQNNMKWHQIQSINFNKEEVTNPVNSISGGLPPLNLQRK